MAYVKTNGVVIKRTNVGDNDAILTIFTDSLGIIKVSAKGIKSIKNKSFTGASLFSFSEFVLRPAKDIYYLNSAELKMSFYSLSANIEKLSYAAYIADITNYVFSENEPEPRALALLLNTFYLLANTNGDLRRIKSVYELKTLFYLGLGAETGSCIYCGEKKELNFFSNEGGTVCPSCAKNAPGVQKISPACLYALRYITSADDKKAFSFKIADRALSELSCISEEFFKRHVEKDFYSLKYLNSIIGKDNRYDA